MTDQEAQLLLADLALIVLLARLLGAAAKRIGQPPVLGEIIAGILLGPTLFHGRITAALLPVTLRLPLSALATFGLVLFTARNSPQGTARSAGHGRGPLGAQGEW
jgi:Kef-type K+ transport system membrane component KefB